MKTDGFVAKTNEISDKEHLEKVAEKVFNVKEITDILLEILSDYVEQVIFMKDEELLYDRSNWMLKFGQEKDKKQYDEFGGIDADLHTLAILIEQIRRFGKIIYDENNESIRFD